jgi:hypothetical protein
MRQQADAAIAGRIVSPQESREFELAVLSDGRLDNSSVKPNWPRRIAQGEKKILLLL